MGRGIKVNKLTAVIVGLIIAAGATYGLFMVISATGGLNAVPKVPVLVATQTIPAGSQVTQADVEVVQYPASVVPPAALSVSSLATGQYAITTISARQIVTSSLLSPTATGTIQEVCAQQAPSPSPIVSASPSASPQATGKAVLPSSTASATTTAGAGYNCHPSPFPIPKGYVAMSIPTSDASGLAPYIQAGDQIDILGDTNGQGSVRYIAEDITIVSTGASASASGSAPASSAYLIVVVPRSTAELLSYLLDPKNGSGATILQYVLRSPSDYSSPNATPNVIPDTGLDQAQFQSLFTTAVSGPPSVPNAP